MHLWWGVQANKLGNKADKLSNDVGSAASNLSGNPAQQAINKVRVRLQQRAVWLAVWHTASCTADQIV